MSEENASTGDVKNDTSTGGDKAATVSTNNDSKSGSVEVDALREQLEAASDKARRFELIYNRIKTDEGFKKAFDDAWAGNKKADSNNTTKDDNANNDPISLMKSEMARYSEEIKSINEQIKKVSSFIDDRDSINARNSISNEYAAKCKELALKEGYDVDSPAFDILFDKVNAEGYKIAQRAGIGHPLEKYNEKLIKEAFDITLKKMKDAGFDDAWKKSKEIREVEARKARGESERLPPLEQFFTKERMKEKGGLSRAMEEAFRARVKI